MYSIHAKLYKCSHLQILEVLEYARTSYTDKVFGLWELLFTMALLRLLIQVTYNSNACYAFYLNKLLLENACRTFWETLIH